MVPCACCKALPRSIKLCAPATENSKNAMTGFAGRFGAAVVINESNSDADDEDKSVPSTAMESACRLKRGFALQPEAVRVIESPSDFYDELMLLISLAKRRVILASLYLGNGTLEEDLVSNIHDAMKRRPELEVTVLLDCLRSTRGKKNSVTVLAPILDRAKIYLYRSPDSGGRLKEAVGERANEIFGLQHMKIYIIDDTVLLSGANLSDQYFTTRQDRYMAFEDAGLCDTFAKIIDAVGSLSFIPSNDGLQFNDPSIPDPFLSKSANAYTSYIREFRKRVLTVVESIPFTKNRIDSKAVYVYPIFQMGPYGIRGEEQLLTKVLGYDGDDVHVVIAAAYFNCSQKYEDLMLKTKYPLDLVVAHPTANSFYKAPGAASIVTPMYSHILQNFNARAHRYRPDIFVHQVMSNSYEAEAGRSTFHSKGIWVIARDYAATFIGSSNYGYRSLDRDLEAGVMVYTQNPDVLKRMDDECQSLVSHAERLHTFDDTHAVPWYVRMLSRFVRSYF